jgi:hypothetical protein
MKRASAEAGAGIEDQPLDPVAPAGTDQADRLWLRRKAPGG